MAPEKQDKMMNWFLLGGFALSLMPLWRVLRNSSPPPIITPSPYVFPSNEQFEDLSGYSRIQIGLSQLSGSDSINCNSAIPYSKKRVGADACTVASLEARKPFRLIYQTGDRGEIVNWGVAGNSNGEVFFLQNVQSSVGINNVVSEERLYACQEPSVVFVKGRPRIACPENRNLAP